MTRPDGFDGDCDEGARDGPDAVAREIADAVESLTDLWTGAAQEAGLRLSSHQLRALRALRRTPGLNLTALAGGLVVGTPTASRLCDRLEAAGMLERTLHPHRRREVRLSLTARGRRALDEVAARRVHALAVALSALGPEERSALSRGMRALLAARSGTPVRPGEPPADAR
ncbi:MarR family winged helix-turn-helix transcriptional regulator [Streptomyces sp. NRRL S-340]|uniref:MarR family winged helix-turn-helix transcriptional regulator n=1 Tax=Streptomyces sp. NRRL S-340 TaxID=1463901 RepID=UPI00056795B2|nr:MarR family winged helix-turn-helix transcriptional regulator [Streptomyces sp. NRRL S-340]